jgi:hypothetical protein
VVEGDAICRTGPGLAYSVQTYLTAGDSADISGYAQGDPLWWYIPIGEAGAEKFCWVSDQVVSVQGNVAALPVLTPPPLPTPSPTATLEGGGLFYYLVAEGTGGPFACGDSLLAIYPGKVRTGNTTEDVKTALNALFSNHHKYYNGLYNSLHASSLRVTDVYRRDGSGEIHVRLMGDFVRPKDDCESKRMYAQVWQTIFHVSGDNSAVVWLNQALFADLLVVKK